MRLSIQPGLDRFEQVTTENGWLLALERLAFEDDLADVEAVAQEMRERSVATLSASSASWVRRLSASLYSDSGR